MTTTSPTRHKDTTPIDQANGKRKCIVFIQRTFPLGGIETLILRITQKLQERDVDIVVCGTKGQMSEALPEKVDFFNAASYKDLTHKLPKYLTEKYKHTEYILVTMHPKSLVAAIRTSRLLPPGKTTSFHLVTHSRAFFFGTRIPFLYTLLKRAFFFAPPASTYFMNEAARSAHEEEWNINLSEYPVIRLPLNNVSQTWEPKKSNELKVVSIGRLVPFKGYNRAAARITRELSNSGINITWDIYGYGEDKENILAEISKNQVEEKVTLKGPVPYSEFFSTLARYDVFVGMGTALLEAAQTGMPSICAIDNDDEKSYGLFFESPSDSVGDIVAEHPRKKIIDDLKALYLATPEQLKIIGKKCADSASTKSESIDNFIESILSANPWPKHPMIQNIATQTLSRLFVVLFDWRERSINRHKPSQP